MPRTGFPLEQAVLVDVRDSFVRVPTYSGEVEIAALAISLTAIVISGVSLLFARRADRRGEAGHHREDRRETLEREEAAARRRARPVPVAAGGRGGPAAAVVSYDYDVRNAGQSPLSELWLWHQDAEGNAVSDLAGGTRVLAPGDPAIRIVVGAHQPRPAACTLWIRWRDDDGEHAEATDISPPPHM